MYILQIGGRPSDGASERSDGASERGDGATNVCAMQLSALILRLVLLCAVFYYSSYG